MKIVDRDISPGTYRNLGGGNGCYWERLSGFTGEFRDIEANDLLDGSTVVEIGAGDQGFYSHDCGTWTRLN